MTPTQQRIAIAQACGTVEEHCEFDYQSPECGRKIVSVWGRAKAEQLLKDCQYPKSKELYVKDKRYPDYCGDLNDMHEAEKILVGYPTDVRNTQYGHYHAQLTKVCGHFLFSITVATAAQRAEAFLRTLNLWRD